MALAPCQIDQLLAAEDALRVFEKYQQQVELACRERHHHPLRRTQLAAGHIQLPVVEADQWPGFFALCA
ncbi:hypothetical protein D3C80_2128930 [compost metagenome]